MSERPSQATSLHPAAPKANTWAAPVSPPGAPATANGPSIATLCPRCEVDPRSDASRTWVWDCAAAGAAYTLLFGFAGATFASIQYSILPLLWVLLGGASTTLGPALGTLFMYYVVDVTSGYTSAYLLVVGAALIVLVLFFPKGIIGSIRDRWARWLP